MGDALELLLEEAEEEEEEGGEGREGDTAVALLLLLLLLDAREGEGRDVLFFSESFCSIEEADAGGGPEEATAESAAVGAGAVSTSSSKSSKSNPSCFIAAGFRGATPSARGTSVSLNSLAQMGW